MKWLVVVDCRFVDGDQEECHPSVHGTFEDEDSAVAYRDELAPLIETKTKEYNASNPDLTVTSEVFVTTVVEHMTPEEAAELHGAYLGL